MDSALVQLRKFEIEDVYNMIYPYGKFDGDYAQACIAINRELKSLCMDNRRDILLLISRAIKIDPSPEDSTSDLCKKILDRVTDTCLSLEPKVSAAVAMNLGLNVIPYTEVDPMYGKYDLEEIQFERPLLVNENMREFFRNANLGPSDPNNPNSAPLNSFFSVGLNGITTRLILTYLFFIYAHINNMQKKHLLSATPRMREYFADTFSRLAIRPRGFNPNRFTFPDLQSIIFDNLVSEFTPDQQALLDDPRTKYRLEQEKDLVKEILGFYRERSRREK